MKVLAKFKCVGVVETKNSDGSTYDQTPSFNAVCGEENKPWSKWTPSGSLRLQITNPSLFGVFAEGKTYLLEISEVTGE